MMKIVMMTIHDVGDDDSDDHNEDSDVATDYDN